MAVPNILALYLLLPEVRQDLQVYLKKIAAGKTVAVKAAEKSEAPAA
jgi:hypothetical protein